MSRMNQSDIDALFSNPDSVNEEESNDKKSEASKNTDTDNSEKEKADIGDSLEDLLGPANDEDDQTANESEESIANLLNEDENKQETNSKQETEAIDEVINTLKEAIVTDINENNIYENNGTKIDIMMKHFIKLNKLKK